MTPWSKSMTRAELLDAIVGGRRDFSGVRFERGMDLRGQKLSGLNFNNARMPRVNLTDAVIHETTFRSAVMSNAVLRAAEIYDADFTGANLYRADAKHTRMSYSKLRDAIIGRAEFDYASLYHVDLRGAIADQHTSFSNSKYSLLRLDRGVTEKANFDYAEPFGAVEMLFPRSMLSIAAAKWRERPEATPPTLGTDGREVPSSIPVVERDSPQGWLSYMQGRDSLRGTDADHPDSKVDKSQGSWAPGPWSNLQPGPGRKP